MQSTLIRRQNNALRAHQVLRTIQLQKKINLGHISQA